MKLFVSIGTVYPMDRLLTLVDQFLQEQVDCQAVVQAGATKETYQNFQVSLVLQESDFRDQFEQSDVIISHAGMGNILLAKEYQKPILVMPRRAELGEHVNDHQLDTIKGVEHHSFIHSFDDILSFRKAIGWAKNWAPQQQDSPEIDSPEIDSPEKDRLIRSLKQYICEDF